MIDSQAIGDSRSDGGKGGEEGKSMLNRVVSWADERPRGEWFLGRTAIIRRRSESIFVVLLLVHKGTNPTSAVKANTLKNHKVVVANDPILRLDR